MGRDSIAKTAQALFAGIASEVQRVRETVDNSVPLAWVWRTFEDLDAGKLTTADHETVARATDEARRFYTLTLRQRHCNFDERFWKSKSGQQLARAEHWLYSEDLINYTEACRLLFDKADSDPVTNADLVYFNSTFIHPRQTAKPLYAGAEPGQPLLVAYFEPHSKNTKYARRVRRSAVEQLKPHIQPR